MGNYLGLDGNWIVEAYRLGLDPKLVMGRKKRWRFRLAGAALP